MNRRWVYLVLCVFIFGCGGKQFGKFSVTEDGSVAFDSTSLSLLPPATVEQMARSKLIDSQANMNNAMARSFESGGGTTVQKANFKIAFANLDFKDAYIFNPEIPSQQILLTGRGGSYILPQSTLPPRIDIYSRNRVVKSVYPIQDYQTYGYSGRGGNAYKKIFNNQEVDLVYTIARIY